MEHYYSEHGDIRFEFSDHLKGALESAFEEKWRKYDSLKIVRSMCMEASSEAEYAYVICEGIGHVAGSTFISPTEDILLRVIKNMLLSFVKAGFLRDEFKLAIWDTICEIQVDWIIDEAIKQRDSENSEPDIGERGMFFGS